MRLAVVILSLVAIALTLIHVRRGELSARHEIQRLQLEQVALRRSLWDQQVKLAHITAPAEVRRRADEMALDLATPDPRQAQGTGLTSRP